MDGTQHAAALFAVGEAASGAAPAGNWTFSLACRLILQGRKP
jgi:hypothetical protein